MRLLLLFLAVLIILNSCGKEKDAVATVGKLTITTDELKQYLARRYADKINYEDVAINEKDMILDQIVVRKLRLNEAYDKGIDKDEKIMDEYTKRKNQMISNRYFEKVIVDKLFPEQLIRAEFEKTKTEVKAKHVLISFKTAVRSMNDRSREEAEKLAQKIAQDLRKNPSKMEEFVLHFSDDRTKNDNKGDLGYFTWGQMVSPFQEKAFEMEVGQISDPVLSDFGYHVILVEDKRPNARFKEEDYENQVDNIKRRLYRTMSDSARTLWDNHLNNLKKEMNYTYQQENIKNFLEGNKKRKENGELSVEKFPADELNKKLVTWKGGELTEKEFLKSYGDRIARYYSNLTDSTKLSTDLTRIASHLMVVQAGDEMGLAEEKKIKEQLDNFMEYSLLKEIEKQEVKDKVNYTEDELKDYYSKNKNEFVIPKKIEIWEIFTTNEDLANRLYKGIKKGQDFKNAAAAFSEDKFYAKKGGYLGYKTENSRGAVSKEAFKAGENQLLAPVKYRNGWAVAKTGKIMPETFKSFEKSQNQIISKIKQQKTRDREKAWETELRAKYEVNINKDLVAKI